MTLQEESSNLLDYQLRETNKSEPEAHKKPCRQKIPHNQMSNYFSEAHKKPLRQKKNNQMMSNYFS